MKKKIFAPHPYTPTPAQQLPFQNYFYATKYRTNDWECTASWQLVIKKTKNTVTAFR